jgi:hypothetical protein
LDNQHSKLTNAMLLKSAVGRKQRVPNDIMHFFVELCLWTSVRNKRVRGWTDINELRAGVDNDPALPVPA